MNHTPSDAQDQADMERLAKDHDAALEALMARHSERLFHYLIRLLQNESTAADLAQETFVRVYQNRRRFKSPNKFSTWLYAIATNLARDRIRWLMRHPNVPLESNTEDPDASLNNILPDTKPMPHESLEADERTATVRRAIAGLPEELRVPLVLAEYEDQSHAEIAMVLECSSKAVEMRIYRARQQLRASLAAYLSPTEISSR
jgi:RNA polymerase sigma-70 factor (ECF subfamily)